MPTLPDGALLSDRRQPAPEGMPPSADQLAAARQSAAFARMAEARMSGPGPIVGPIGQGPLNAPVHHGLPRLHAGRAAPRLPAPAGHPAPPPRPRPRGAVRRPGMGVRHGQ
jgi:hypothetical protein